MTEQFVLKRREQPCCKEYKQRVREAIQSMRGYQHEFSGETCDMLLIQLGLEEQ